MSFTADVKNEITKQNMDRLEKIAFLSAYLNVAANINDNSIKIITENAAVARNIFKKIKDLYNITPFVAIKNQINFKNHIYSLTIYDFEQKILNDLSLYKNSKRTYIPSKYLIADEALIRAYFCGLFLAKGSVNDPKTARYHLEIVLDNIDLANFIVKLMLYYNLNAKIIDRNNNYVIYLKEAEKISDFLRLIDTYNAVMYYEDIRIYRDHKNMTNRLNNCEQANIDKSFNASYELIKSINIIIDNDDYNHLSDALKTTIDYKLKYPETTLLELSYIISNETGNKVTKSGLNHRLRKIKEIAKNSAKKSK